MWLNLTKCFSGISTSTKLTQLPKLKLKYVEKIFKRHFIPGPKNTELKPKHVIQKMVHSSSPSSPNTSSLIIKYGLFTVAVKKN